MINFYSLEAQIKNDWSLFRAFVALHPYYATIGALAVGFFVGHFV